MTSSNADRSTTDSWVVDRFPRLWTLWTAARPSQLALIVVVYMFGVGMATTGPPLIAADSAPAGVHSVHFLETVLMGVIALLPVAVAIHSANEYADVETDALTTRTPFSGGSGAIDRAGVSPSVLRSATVGSAALAVVVVAGVDLIGGFPLDAIALLAAIFGLGLAYSLPPIAFVRRGVGEVVNAVLGGVLLPLYGVAVVASPRPTVVLAVVPFTLLVGCNLLATHWPDRAADAAVGKRTLAVRWSPTRIRRAFATLAATAAVVTVILWLEEILPDAVALAHLAPVPFVLWSWAVLTRQRSPLPAVLAMVVLAVTGTIAWWWTGVVT
ncbi:prenyltransferase [Natronorubrum thiooxidans]|uniref:1,4-dihydroxy-2-naphthoate octaprenyltransferase n=1 Tax=Natronorubrum thiooxidans TaxID=308853 RepID=A0A1N7GMH1_9EURY|nr:prenyltransferase [Natronorubrum thiooxidans]SIS13793.1 1,4-dihydroxy-2-naphthoate octaprenyltransferase [Natronorubrum thiooxidans]